MGGHTVPGGQRKVDKEPVSYTSTGSYIGPKLPYDTSGVSGACH